MEFADISVVVAIYNTEKYLRECLESIANQTVKPKEVLMINDGSTDSSINIAKQFEDEYRNFHLITQINKGLSGARNTGIKMAKGDYICFIDSDDFIEPDYLRNLWTGIIEYDGDMAFGDYYEVDDKDNLLPEGNHKKCYESGIIRRNYAISKIFAVGIHHNAIATIVMWNKLIKTQIMKQLMFKEGVLHEDEFMIMPLLLRCKTIVWTDEKIYAYRQQSASITHDSNNLIARLKVLDAYEERIHLGKKYKLDEIRYDIGTSYMKNLTIAYYRLLDEHLQNGKKETNKIRFRAFKGLLHYPGYIGKRQSLHMLMFVLSPERYRMKYF